VPTSRLTSQSYSQAVNIFFKFVIETLFKVTLARWSDGTATTTHVLAMDLDHAKRVAWKKWKSVTVEPAKPFPRFDERKVGKFNR
jgi:hypothetical protein